MSDTLYNLVPPDEAKWLAWCAARDIDEEVAITTWRNIMEEWRYDPAYIDNLSMTQWWERYGKPPPPRKPTVAEIIESRQRIY